MDNYLDLNGKWILENDRTGTTEATVPGDITNDLYRAGKITDPYFGLNHRQIGWIPREDFIYKKVFDAPKDFLGGEVLLEFDGIDVFSEIYLNGELLGKTENMFLKYTFSVGNILKPKGNQLEVRMKSTLNEMDKFDCAGYMSIFNVPRVFVRKAQCHFGWDWAPDICGYGIWGDVRLKKVAKKRLLNVQVIADDKGNATFLATLNYNIRATVDILGKAIDGSAAKCNGDKLIFTVYDCGADGAIIAEGETAVTGRKNFRNFKIENCKLWWPNGYGEQSLYGYKVQLCENGEEISAVCGKFGFRKVELLTEPIDAELMGYKIRINGKDIFVKGSNWVPIECFTGTVKTEKYEKLISLAKDANLNMLRVWGGGIYEKDAFYDLCDRYGIMVWQDFMFACSDLPEDNDKWVKNAVSECRYQIERLRNHPSVVYWCGGNEKTGSYGLMISKGDYFIDCILQGLVYSLDKTRPYARQSPCSLTDVGNDKNSGESHGGSFERALAEGVGNYRKYVAETVVPFISECAIMGPNSVETNKKIYPSDKLWPLGEVWRDRLMKNPYSAYPLDFTDRQLKYASAFYGEPISLEDFTVKGMTVHAETLKTEFEYARANSDKCSGFLNWMYSDIWPSGSWSIVDYYLEPKAAYYQMKRSAEQLLATVFENKDGKNVLAVINDSTTDYHGEISVSAKKYNGEILRNKKVFVSVPSGGVYRETLDLPKCDYVAIEYEAGKEKRKNLYSPDMWRGYKGCGDVDIEVTEISPKKAIVRLKAKKFTKTTGISFKDNFAYRYDDNYFDMEEGEEKSVTVTCKNDADFSDVNVSFLEVN